MTCKDYERIARCVAPFNSPNHANPGRLVAEAITQNLARALAENNPRFDRQRFLRACGVK